MEHAEFHPRSAHLTQSDEGDIPADSAFPQTSASCHPAQRCPSSNLLPYASGSFSSQSWGSKTSRSAFRNRPQLDPKRMADIVEASENLWGTAS